MRSVRSLLSKVLVRTISEATRAEVMMHSRAKLAETLSPKSTSLTFVESAKTARAKMSRATKMKIAFPALRLLRPSVHQALTQLHEELAHKSGATVSRLPVGAILFAGCRRPMAHPAGALFETARPALAAPRRHIAAGAKG